MSFVIQCSACDQELRIPDDADGKRVRCPACREIFVAQYKFNAREFYRENGVARERLWVGDIVGLFIDHMNHGGDISTVGNWTVYVAIPELRILALESSNQNCVARGIRHCTLGECSEFQLLESFLKLGVDPERAIQSMAFEICRVIEPDWDEIIARKWDS